MHILVDLDGVLRGRKDDPIAVGVQMVGALSVYNKLTLLSSQSAEATKHWLDTNKVVDFDDIVDLSAHLEGESLQERQITLARAKGPVDIIITNNPTLWAFAFNQGLAAVLFGLPSYTRPEFRPDAPRKVRAWSDIEKAIEDQNALRTKDARLIRTEALNFE